IPVALLLFLNWIGANTHHVLYDAGVFALTGVLAGYAARRSRVAYAGLLAALAMLVAWLLLWEKILDHPSANTFRWLLVAAAALGHGRVFEESVPQSAESAPIPGFGHPSTNGLQHLGWDVYLLIVALALVWIGSRARTRALGYVGGVGLLAFLISVSVQITRV